VGMNIKPTKDQIKKLKEMMAKRVQSCDCPELSKKCSYKLLEADEYTLLCKDVESNQQSMAIHMQQRHNWEVCPHYQEVTRSEKGKTPGEWSAIVSFEQKRRTEMKEHVCADCDHPCGQ
jgi:ATP-dependent helicase YprA (DUF1998 family)